MFSKLRYFCWRRGLSDSLEAPAKEIAAHLVELGFWNLSFVFQEKTTVTRIQNILRFTKNSIPKIQCLGVLGMDQSVTLTGPWTGMGLWVVVILPWPGDERWNWTRRCHGLAPAYPAKGWWMLALKRWNPFDTRSTYQTERRQVIDGTAHRPRTTLAAPLHNHSVQFISPEPNNHEASNLIMSSVTFIVVLVIGSAKFSPNWNERCEAYNYIYSKKKKW